MAEMDALNLLRRYHMEKEKIVERDGQIIFGEFAWPKTTKTSYLQFGSGRDGNPKEYYTLECLLHLLKNVSLQHPQYVRKASEEHIPYIKRPDRKNLLAFLDGIKPSSASIDASAMLESPTKAKRASDDAEPDQAAKKQRGEKNTDKNKDDEEEEQKKEVSKTKDSKRSSKKKH